MKKLTGLIIAAAALAFAGTAVAGDKVRIGTEGAYPPFNEKNEKGELVGFDVDIAKALCAKMGAECTFVAQDWDGIIPALKAKKYDAIVASMSITDERKKQVDFTNPYYANFLAYMAKKGSGLKTDKAGLKGKVVGAQRATISSQYLEDNMADVVKVKLYDTQTAAYGDLKTGRLDAMLSDIYPALQWINDPANSGYEIVGERIDINDQIGIAVRKGDPLREKLNKALDGIVKDGTYEKISSKYFGRNIM
ncbi:MAG: ABC transporter substrate-binding protein [Alphaproteobacteria bacterium]|nr:ABC transporter substrate-binding protein [Alphaproteobacteria bacterium]